MRMGDELTARQRSVLQFVIDYHRRHRVAPSVREIGRGVGLRSPAGVHRILDILKARGYLDSEPDKQRTWRFAGPLDGPGLPVLGAIAAGAPIEALGEVEEMVAVSPLLFGDEACFGLRVRGDSMEGAHILDGDLAVIRPGVRVISGQIGAVLVADLLTEATLKIVRRDGQTLTLAAANPAYADMVFRNRERRQVTIVGKLAGVVRGWR